MLVLSHINTFSHRPIDLDSWTLEQLKRMSLGEKQSWKWFCFSQYRWNEGGDSDYIYIYIYIYIETSFNNFNMILEF